MLFRDRQEAGQKLAETLKALPALKAPNAVVIGLPRGGVVVAVEVARALKLPLDIIVPRKIGAPGNPEYAIGAVTETGETIWNEEERRGTDPAYLQKIVTQEQQEAVRRLKLYRTGRPPRNFKDKIVILVDDGIATGLTMQAAIKTARAEGAASVIVAAPVAAADTFAKLKKMADQVVILNAPDFFGAVGQFYQYFDQTTDEEVVAILSQNMSENP